VTSTHILDKNGGYINPPRIKRQFRDPHADWWDKQERRNFGEPVHEDNDMLGMFSPYEYTWTTPGKGALQVLAVVLVFVGIVGVVKVTYPDKPSYPREFEGGLERELGGPGAMRVRYTQAVTNTQGCRHHAASTANMINRQGNLAILSLSVQGGGGVVQTVHRYLQEESSGELFPLPQGSELRIHR